MKPPLRRTGIPIRPTRYFRRTTVPLVAACLGLGGCGGPEAEATRVVVRDSVGITIVESLEPLWRPGEAWTISDTPVLDLGSESGPDQFYRVAAAFRIPGERIAVLNAGSQELRLFEWSGAHIATAGGPGDGPGEFRAVNSAALIGGSISVYDGGLTRLSVFDLDGRFVDSRRIELRQQLSASLAQYRLAGAVEGRGDVLVKRSSRGNTGLSELTVWWDSAATLLADETGMVVGAFGEAAGMQMWGLPGRSGFLRWGVSSSAEMHDGSLYIGDGREYEVRVYGTDGVPMRMIRRSVARSPAAADERLVEWMLGSPEARDAPPEAVAEFRSDIAETPRAEQLPVFQDLLVDALGYVWVERYRPAFGGRVGLWVEGPPRWDVFDPSGEWLGKVVLPDSFDPTEFGADYVLGVWRDELDTEHVRAYGLERGR